MRCCLQSFIFISTVNVVAVIYNHLLILRFVNILILICQARAYCSRCKFV